MNQTDTYYKALNEYKRIINESEQCVLSRKMIAQEASTAEKISVSYYNCIVEEDWIAAIEKGLTYIEKAIKEERQFIYSNGEVLPIELVKSVSRESIAHLARHSNLIADANEKKIIPEKLYTVERNNDYAVYENRFLYMLLCYLRDFVSIRYNKISELVGKYDGSLILKKQIEASDKKLDFSVQLDESHINDDYLVQNSNIRLMLERIDIIQKTVGAFLATPLMECAAKAPLITPPITKTNILKMDNNFKGAVDLYDFIISYDAPGYSVEQVVLEKAPFDTEVSESMSDVITLLSFLTYQYGLDIKKLLKAHYEREEAIRDRIALEKKTEQIDRLKKRLLNSKTDPEEYIFELERHITELKRGLHKKEILSLELEQCQKREIFLNKKIAEQSRKIDSLYNETKTLITAHQSEILRLNTAHSEKIDILQALHDQKIREIAEAHENEIQEIKKSHLDEFRLIRDEFNASIDEERNKLSVSMDKCRLAEERIEELKESIDLLTENNRIAESRIKALCAINGHSSEIGDFTDKKHFDDLEKEFTAFKKFYDSQWKKTKKKIRKNAFKLENIKKTKG